jgi:hypothetical protein
LEADIAGAEPAEPILLPPDLNMDTSLANQSLLAARSIGDLVVGRSPRATRQISELVR